MPGIKVKENESFDIALRRFKRICEKAGIISIMRRREYYEKPKWERKRKTAQARKRWLKKTQRDVASTTKGARGAKKAKDRKTSND